MSRDYKIRPATASDIHEFYGRTTASSLRALAIEWNGGLAGIAGVTIEPNGFTFFSDMKPGIYPPKITIWRVAREIMEWVKTLRLPVGASTDNPHFLDRLGFRFVGDFNEKKLYRLEHEISSGAS